ncbi:hypothetical protein [Facklamia sp. P13055]|uniref:hypothetical protein n=1 Tax=unclassified Facklamia TaxID=2622293 RepID=UPI003D184D8D
MIIIALLSTIVLWFSYLSVITFYRFKRDGIVFANLLSYLVFPLIILQLHIKVANRFSNAWSKKLKFIGLYFINYKQSLIFFSELLLENAAQLEATGYSPILCESKKIKRKSSPFKLVYEWVKLPSSSETFKKAIYAH